MNNEKEREREKKLGRKTSAPNRFFFGTSQMDARDQKITVVG